MLNCTTGVDASVVDSDSEFKEYLDHVISVLGIVAVAGSGNSATVCLSLEPAIT